MTASSAAISAGVPEAIDRPKSSASTRSRTAQHQADIVLDEQDRDAPLLGETNDEVAELGGFALIEAGGRLVEQQNGWLGRDQRAQSPRAAGARRAVRSEAIEVGGEVELLHGGDRRGTELWLARMNEIGGVGKGVAWLAAGAQVVVHRHVVEQLERLERASDPARARRWDRSSRWRRRRA